VASNNCCAASKTAFARTVNVMRAVDKVIADLKMRSSDDQVAIMRALADDNGYLVVAGYSITGIDPTRGEKPHD
jgi:hypothetical protein